MFCDFGCGKEAIKRFKSGRYCCSDFASSCSAMREKNNASLKVNLDWKHIQELYNSGYSQRGIIKKLSITQGQINSGIHQGFLKMRSLDEAIKLSLSLGKFSHPQSQDTKDILSQIAKDRGFGGYVKGSGRGKKGWYKGFYCDSSWELAYVIYCLDNEIDIKRNYERRTYIWEGTTKNYIPDFIVDGILVEIKGYKTEQWIAKLEANPDVKVLYEVDLQPMLDYVKMKHGKDYINMYERKCG